jgi:phytoene dehydrogenase-like protein
MTDAADVLVIGSGFGGLGAALELSAAGRSVILLEAMKYPGGCASTHTRRGVRFESGATLINGLGPGQLFRRWLDRWDVRVQADPLDPVMLQVTAAASVPLRPTREGWLDALIAAGEPADGARRFLEIQGRIAKPLWELFDQPELLPPLGVASLAGWVARSPRLLPALPSVGRPMSAVLDRAGVGPGLLRTLVDRLCQITVQCGADEAESIFAIGALDGFFRGAVHLDGGVGVLADALVECVRRAGGQVQFGQRVVRLEPDAGGWRVEANHGTWRARQVVANLPPGDVDRLLGGPMPSPSPGSWGAVMLYRQLAPGLPPEAGHLQLIGDGRTDGLSVYASISAAHEDRGARTLVASSPIGLPASQADVERVQAVMRRTIEVFAPWLHAATVEEWTASPRTFARFTGRSTGEVGGLPRRAGRSAYAGLFPRPVRPGLWVVGDSVLYGPSMLSTAIGGHRVAAAVLTAGGGAGRAAR